MNPCCVKCRRENIAREKKKGHSIRLFGDSAKLRVDANERSEEAIDLYDSYSWGLGVRRDARLSLREEKGAFALVYDPHEGRCVIRRVSTSTM